MPIPSTINDLSTTAASNSPGGGENPFPDLDNYLRAHASFIAALRDGKLDASAVSAFMLTVLNDADAATARATLGAVGTSGDQTIAGVKTFSSSPVLPGNATTNLQAVPKQQLDNSLAARAALAGSGSQQFSVANASSPAHAVALGQFLSSRTSNGSLTLPDGLIIKFGRVVSTVGTGGSVLFTDSFPSSVLSCTVSFDTSFGVGFVGRHFGLNNTGFSYSWDNFNTSGSGQSALINFIAIGF